MSELRYRGHGQRRVGVQQHLRRTYFVVDQVEESVCHIIPFKRAYLVYIERHLDPSLPSVLASRGRMCGPARATNAGSSRGASGHERRTKRFFRSHIDSILSVSFSLVNFFFTVFYIPGEFPILYGQSRRKKQRGQRSAAAGNGPRRAGGGCGQDGVAHIVPRCRGLNPFSFAPLAKMEAA